MYRVFITFALKPNSTRGVLARSQFLMRMVHLAQTLITLTRYAWRAFNEPLMYDFTSCLHVGDWARPLKYAKYKINAVIHIGGSFTPCDRTLNMAQADCYNDVSKSVTWEGERVLFNPGSYIEPSLSNEPLSSARFPGGGEGGKKYSPASNWQSSLSKRSKTADEKDRPICQRSSWTTLNLHKH